VSTVNSEDDKTRSDEYWMGVRDALRMVDSFTKWAKRNPGRAKSLEDFIHDGLIAAAKRCESCLRDKLGIKFEDDEEDTAIREEFREQEEKKEDDEPVIEEEFHELAEAVEEEEEDEMELVTEDASEFESESIEPEFEQEEQELPIEEQISNVEPEYETPPSSPYDETSISLDSVERRDYEEMEDLSIEGPPREFSTDFELVEPTPLVIDEDYEPMSEPEEEALSEVTEETSPIPESEGTTERPSFTWAEYEEAISPSSEPEPLDSEEEFLATEEESTSFDESEELPEEPPEPPLLESSFDTEEDEDDSADDFEEEGEKEISEPPPPPPPESEEDEEERKRRARRLFFGD